MFAELFRKIVNFFEQFFSSESQENNMNNKVDEVKDDPFMDNLDDLKGSFELKKQQRILRQMKLKEEQEELLKKKEKLKDIPLFNPDDFPDEDEEEQGDESATEEITTQIGGEVKATPIAELAETKLVDQEKFYRLADSYTLPNLELLNDLNETYEVSDEDIRMNQDKLQYIFDSFRLDVRVTGAIVGPRVTLYKVTPASGVKVEEITKISGNIAMELKAISLRTLTPVPGKKYCGVEIPNAKLVVIGMRQQLLSKIWNNPKQQIPMVLGKNISGEDITLDLALAPHLLIAGATGSGKSVCLNNMIISLLYKFTPEELRLVLVDPKVVEFSVFKDLPHLVVPVITETDKVRSTLAWVIKEMEKRYQILAKVGAKNLATFNDRGAEEEQVIDQLFIPKKLPFLVVVIDELADIMMTSRADVEVSLARIAQLSRAVGIHMIIATQRPSVNVITGVIKANFPTRIAFQVTSVVDSRTILDSKGAESLLGRGDMLYNPPGASNLQRIQAPFTSDEEVEKVANFVSAQADQKFNLDVFNEKTEIQVKKLEEETGVSSKEEELLEQAIAIILETQKTSISYLQRRLKIGYNRAATLVEILEQRGILGPQLGNSPREILI